MDFTFVVGVSDKVLHFKDLLGCAVRRLDVVLSGHHDESAAFTVELVDAVGRREDEAAVDDCAAAPLQEGARTVLQLDGHLVNTFKGNSMLFEAISFFKNAVLPAKGRLLLERSLRQ